MSYNNDRYYEPEDGPDYDNWDAQIEELVEEWTQPGERFDPAEPSMFYEACGEVPELQPFEDLTPETASPEQWALVRKYAESCAAYHAERYLQDYY